LSRQKTAYELFTWLEFSRVLFRSGVISPPGRRGCDGEAGEGGGDAEPLTGLAEHRKRLVVASDRRRDVATATRDIGQSTDGVGEDRKSVVEGKRVEQSGGACGRER